MAGWPAGNARRLPPSPVERTGVRSRHKTTRSRHRVFRVQEVVRSSALRDRITCYMIMGPVTNEGRAPGYVAPFRPGSTDT